MVHDFMFPDQTSTSSIDKAVSFYAGIMASCFSLAQFLSSIIWGKLSDKVGRRKVILTGFLGNVLTAPLFGLAPTYLLAVLARCLSGLVNGNAGVGRAYAKEITDNSNQARMFSYLGLAWGAGVMLGPLLGGALSHISDTLPGIFPPDSVWGTQPYFLPMVASALISLIGLVTGLIGLKVNSRSQQSDRKVEGLAHNLEFVLYTSVFALSALVFLGFQEVFPLWCKARRVNGGLSFTQESVIGTIQASGGLAMIVFQLVFGPWSLKRFGVFSVLFTCIVTSLCVFFLVPFLTIFSGAVLYIALAVVYLFYAIIQTSAVTASIIGVNSTVPEGQLGTANGIAQSAVSLCRFLGPAAYGGLFGWSVDNGLDFPLNSHFVFNLSVLILGVALCLLYFLRRLRQKNTHLNDPLLPSAN